MGKAFVLQGGMYLRGFCCYGCDLIVVIGDCAELFEYCNQEIIEAKVKLLLQMSLVLVWGMHLFRFLWLVEYLLIE